jgi:hypothetical protein
MTGNSIDISMRNQGTRKAGCRISENQDIRKGEMKEFLNLMP